MQAVCLDSKGVAQFELLHNRGYDHDALALAFDLLALNGDDYASADCLSAKLP